MLHLTISKKNLHCLEKIYLYILCGNFIDPSLFAALIKSDLKRHNINKGITNGDIKAVSNEYFYDYTIEKCA